MTEDEKIAMLRVLCDIPADEMPDSSLIVYLGLAKSLVMRRLYQFVTDSFEELSFPAKYDNLQVQIANEMILRRGAEGETSHKEDGVDRSYENAGVSESLLKQIRPYVGAL